jgi:hypothetical protein
VDDATLRTAVRTGVTADQRLLAALDAGAAEHAEAENDKWGASHVWPRRVRHLAQRGLLLDDVDATLDDLRALAAEDVPFTVVNRLLASPTGEEVYTVLLTGTPPRVRVAFSHHRPV